MAKQTFLRTNSLTPNENISFPIGTIHTVQNYYRSLGLKEILGKHKTKGIDFNSLVQALLSYWLTENQSVTRASEWINRKEVLRVFKLKTFEQRTLYRVLETLGANREEIMADIQDALFERYHFEHTDVNMDWTSLVLYGMKCPLGKKGYSRDHRPDKKQITVGITELAHPINVAIGMTVRAGNVNDQTHFKDTFDQVSGHLKEGSLVVFDQGAHSKYNIERAENENLKYLTIRPLNKSDEKNRIKAFDKRKVELVDEKNGVYGFKHYWPSRIDYFFFSESLQKDQIEAKLRKATKQYDEAIVIQHSLESSKGLPKRFKINNPLVECEYWYQTKLDEMSEKEAMAVLKKAAITGREGFFCLVSNKDLTLHEALEIYRRKDSIEKIFNSLKNEIEIGPLRVWSENGIYGALLLGFIAQLIISLIRFEYQELKHVSPKFIILSLMNLTVTVEIEKSGKTRHIYSNFNPVSDAIFSPKQGFG